MRVLTAVSTAVGLFAAVAHADPIPVLAYHDITPTREADEYSLTQKEFEQHMAYLYREGYRAIRLDDLDRARRGEGRLPDKPVLITFDDGLKSFAVRALPLLERYGYPAVLTVVSAWVDGRSVPPGYRGKLLSWEELRSLARSPLVEIVSHGDDLHGAVPANPQGNEAPAVVTRRYDAASGRYESEEAFRARIRADLERSRNRMQAELGRAPRAIAWPYGLYDRALIEEAVRLGMEYYFTLDEAPTRIAGLPRINRVTFRRFRELRRLDEALTFRAWREEQRRFVEVALDDIAGRPPQEREARLSALLARLELLGVNAVLLSPFSPDRRYAYFANDQLPAADDILHRVLHQLRVRLGIDHVYMRLPVWIEGVNMTRLYRELARRHRPFGVVLEGAPDGAAALAELFRYYRPDGLIGVAGGTGEVPWSDFRLYTLEVGANGLDAAPATGGSGTLFLVQRGTASDERLVQALRVLRRAGARNYGYGLDEFLDGRPDVRRIVRELRAYTAGEAVH
jgi:biofilm PGA synthesis lipoprotein PgaB